MRLQLFCFFFSSRRRHTRYWRDWSSDVCSSDLFILANNFMSIVPFAQISPNSRFAFPLVLAVIVWVLYNYIGIREQGAARYFKDAAIPPGVPIGALILVTPIELQIGRAHV